MARDELQQAEHDADVESDGEGEDATETTALLSAKRERRQAATAKAIASALDHTAQARAMSIDPLTPSSAFDETLRDRLRGQRAEGEAVEDEDEDDEEEGEGDEARGELWRALKTGPRRTATWPCTRSHSSRARCNRPPPVPVPHRPTSTSAPHTSASSTRRRTARNRKSRVSSVLCQYTI